MSSRKYIFWMGIERRWGEGTGPWLLLEAAPGCEHYSCFFLVLILDGGIWWLSSVPGGWGFSFFRVTQCPWFLSFHIASFWLTGKSSSRVRQHSIFSLKFLMVASVLCVLKFTFVRFQDGGVSEIVLHVPFKNKLPYVKSKYNKYCKNSLFSPNQRWIICVAGKRTWKPNSLFKWRKAKQQSQT